MRRQVVRCEGLEKVALLDVDESSALVVITHLDRKRTGRYLLNHLTPRFDLRRDWTPSGEPVQRR